MRGGKIFSFFSFKFAGTNLRSTTGITHSQCWWAWVGLVRLGELCRHEKENIMQGLRGGIATNI